MLKFETYDFFLFCLAITLPFVNGIECPVQDRESVAVCAMCSDTAASVKWNIGEGVEGTVITFSCSDENGTVIVDHNKDVYGEQGCFQMYHSYYTSDDRIVFRNGTTSVDSAYLRPGIECTLTLAYYIVDYMPLVKESSCTIRTEDECRENPDQCIISQVCWTNEGRREYQCGRGFSGSACENINECVVGNYSCHEQAECIDTIGHYTCQCHPGFKGDGHTNCTNIDECASNHSCHPDAQCLDTNGSYNCTCLPGFKGDGKNCANINECERNEPCSENAECSIVSGKHTCQCKAGFTGESDNCTDINECNSNLSCSRNARCSNTNGSYVCECLPGYYGDGFEICSDMNECEGEHNLCSENSKCQNNNGSYQCLCLPGFTGNGYICNDIDECEDGNPCHEEANFHNRLGGYRCQCKRGFEGDGEANCTAQGVGDDIMITVGIPLLIGTTLLIIIFILIPMATLRYLKKRKFSLLSTSLYNTELDVNYKPTFWNGSLHSIISVYEKLAFKELVTITKDDNTNEEYADNFNMPSVIKDIGPTNSKCLSRNNYQKCPVTTLKVTSRTNCRYVAPPATQKTEAFTNSYSSCGGDSVQIDEETQRPIPAGYIQESCCNPLSTKSSGTWKPRDDSVSPTIGQKSNMADSEGDNHRHSSTCSITYQSISKLQENIDNSNSGKSTRELMQSDQSSSGYYTKSNESQSFPSLANYKLNLSTWNSESSLNLNDNYTGQSESVDESIWFTLNTDQYVNELEERTISKITFSVAPQQ